MADSKTSQLNSAAALTGSVTIPVVQTVQAVDLVADFGAVADGVTNNAVAFGDFKTWGRLQTTPVFLTMPAGSYYLDDADLSSTLFNGISNLVVSAYGASLTFADALSFTGANSFRQEAGYSAKVNTVAIGAGVAVLKNAGDAALFTVGDWCSLNALELQGSSGYPPNHHYNQFVQIRAKAGTSLYFWPLALDTYLDTYPDTSTPLSDYETGGPATLHLMKGRPGYDVVENGWGVNLEIRGLQVVNTLGQPGEQVYMPCKSVTLVDCDFVDCAPIPTANQNFLGLRVTTNSIQVENDKDCETVEWRNCALRSMHTQSSSIRNLIIDGTSFASFCNGTARNTIIRGASDLVNLTIGSTYGNSETLLIQSPAVIRDLTDPILTNNHVVANFDNAGGDLEYIGTGMLNWGAPGSLVYLGGDFRFGGPSAVVSGIGASGGDQAILETDLPDPLPDLPAVFGGERVFQHPCAAVTVESGVTGCDAIEVLALAPAGLPLRSYNYSEGYFQPAEELIIQGRLVSIMVNVVRPYTGPSATATLHLGNATDTQLILDASGAQSTFGATINAKVSGERTIAPGAITGAQSGDALGSAPGLIVFVGSVTVLLTGDLTGVAEADRPLIEYEILTTQFWS